MQSLESKNPRPSATSPSLSALSCRATAAHSELGIVFVVVVVIVVVVVFFVVIIVESSVADTVVVALVVVGGDVNCHVV